MEGNNLLPQNPLVNHLVIERLISYLGFQELKAIRGVCKLWKTLATPLFRAKAIVKLKAHQVTKFLCSDSIYCIDRNFVLDSWELSSNPTLYDEFFQKFGNAIREINFNQCAFSSHKVFIDVLQLFPNLEILILGGSYVLDAYNDEDLRVVMDQKAEFRSVKTLEITFSTQNRRITSWKSMFKYFPNVSVLNAQCRTSSDLTEMLQSILEAKLQLTDFSSFLTEFTEVQLNLLAQANFKLRSLDINLARSITSRNLLLLLKSSQNSMTALKLFHGLQLGFPRGFPYSITLKNVKNLELLGDMTESFEFLQFLPKLTTLIVLQHEDEDADDPTSASCFLIANTPRDVNPHLNLKSLSMEFKLTPECVTRLEKLSPNLTRLSAHLDDDSIRAVFEFLVELEELSILGTEVTDEGFTGISIRDLLLEHEDMAIHRVFPYIGGCQRLRKLSLYAQRQENVSDYAVLYGLIDIPELTTVDLPCTAISDAGILSLQLKPNMINVSAKYFIDVMEGNVVLRPEKFQRL